MKNNRISIPAKLKHQLFYDDQFFREACELSKLKLNNGFPKQDQWCDETGLFHIEFALAGYSPSDLEIIVEDDEFVVRTIKSQKFTHIDADSADPNQELVDSNKKSSPKPKMQNGIISRGIARRSFTYGLVLSSEYDLYEMNATMDNGLLHVSVPIKKNVSKKVITISQDRSLYNE